MNKYIVNNIASWHSSVGKGTGKLNRKQNNFKMGEKRKKNTIDSCFYLQHSLQFVHCCLFFIFDTEYNVKQCFALVNVEL